MVALRFAGLSFDDSDKIERGIFSLLWIYEK